ncbi:MAG: hypothetical protein R3D34_15640 [Nitratireductor sp.]
MDADRQERQARLLSCHERCAASLVKTGLTAWRYSGQERHEQLIRLFARIGAKESRFVTNPIFRLQLGSAEKEPIYVPVKAIRPYPDERRNMTGWPIALPVRKVETQVPSEWQHQQKTKTPKRKSRPKVKTARFSIFRMTPSRR